MRISFGCLKVSEKSKKYLKESCEDLFGYKPTRGVISGTSTDMAKSMALPNFGAKLENELINPGLCLLRSVFKNYAK